VTIRRRSLERSGKFRSEWNFWIALLLSHPYTCKPSQRNTSTDIMSDHREKHHGGPHSRTRKPLSEQDERLSSDVSPAVEFIEDVAIPPSRAHAATDAPPKRKKRQRVTNDDEYSCDELPRAQTGRASRTTPPYSTLEWCAELPSSQQPSTNNHAIGEWLTNLLNGKDARISHLEEISEYFETLSDKHIGELMFLFNKIVSLQQDIAGVKRKFPYPTFELECLWHKLKDTITSKLDECAAALGSKDKRIATLEMQIASLESKAGCRSEERNSEVDYLKAKIEDVDDLRTRLAASQLEVKKQAMEILQL
jgi:hypothetical protein